MWRELFRVLLRRPPEPTDERTVKSHLLDRLETNGHTQVERVDRLLNQRKALDSYRRVGRHV